MGANIVTSFFQLFRFDPAYDKDVLPVVNRTPEPTQLRTAKVNGEGVHQDSTGKQYARGTEQNESGETVYVLDSQDVKTETDVPSKLTKYDYHVFRSYKATDKYKFFDLDKYRVIKERAFSKAIDGQPVSAVAAAKMAVIQALKGCGERRVKDYYKAMNEAQKMYLTKAPLPVDRGLS